ncbi:MAG: hypothetical protein KDK70_19170 [Myxococcales bacterium]|nr:hypothetical protein [Myxococcales bacterium]
MRTLAGPISLLALLGIATACTQQGGRDGSGSGYTGFPGGDDDDVTASDGSDGTAGTAGDGATEAGSADASDDDPSGPGVKFDTPNGSGGDPPPPEEGCQKVDFLFVIDSSGSMEDEQDALLASFPGFIAAIEDTLMLDDFHVMVVDAGATPGGGCDGILGAGRTTSASGQNCQLAGGHRYATQDQPDLAQAFSCMASRGYAGSPDERTMDSLLQSVTVLDTPGQCNDGFLRDDAILVVTIITDEEDSSSDNNASPALDGSCEPADSDPNSSGAPALWRDQLIQVKAGDPAAVVVLSLLGDCDVGGACPGIVVNQFNPAAPITGAEPAPRLRAFTESFEHGSVGPVCAPDYAPFFEAAVSVIDSACSEFEPPG